MIISCPKCKTRFVVAPQAIGPDGRTVRCSRCSNTWFQEGPDENLEIVPEKVIKPSEAQDNQNQKQASPASQTGDKIKSNVPVAVVKKDSFGPAKKWGLFLAVFVGILFSLYYFRPQLEDQFEFARTYYQKWDDYVAGQSDAEPEAVTTEAETLPQHPSSFLNMTNAISVSPQDGVPTLSIDVEITNASEFAINLPPVNVDIKNAAGEIVYNTIYTLEQNQIAAAGELLFTIDVPDFPSDSSLVDLSLMWEDTP